MFLAVITKKVIDTPATAAIAEDLTANPPVVGVAAVAEVSHKEVDQTYVEDSASQVAINMASGRDITYYNIKFNAALRPTLKTVREKGRTAAPAREEVTIEDQDGNELGVGVV